MSFQMRLPRAPWGGAWANTVPTDPAEGSTVPRITVPRQAANSRASMGAALMGPPDMPQDDPNGFKSRIGSAIQGLGSQLNPVGGGVESFLSGATGAYTNTQQSLTERAQAPSIQQQAAQEQALKDRETQARIDYYKAQAERAGAPPTAPLRADDWVPVLGDPGTPAMQQNRATGATKPILGPDGKPAVNRSKPATTPRTPAEHYQVGADGIARRVNPRTHQMEVILDENGQPFRPRAPGRQGGSGLTPRTNAPPLTTRMDQHDRWDALKASGMSDDAATAQVKKEHDAGQLDD